MMGRKNLSEIRRELNDLFVRLPGGPEVWFEREIPTVAGQRDRDVETFKMLQAALAKPARKRRSRGTKATGSRS